MKALVTICLLLISVPAIANGQPRPVGRRQTVGGRGQVPAPRGALTRAQVREAERGLAEMGYWTGPVDGVLDAGTRAALIAFQKWEGRPVTGRLTINELEAIRTSANSTAKESWPRPREVGYAHVEVDLDRQVLMIVGDPTTKGTDIDPTLLYI